MMEIICGSYNNMLFGYKIDISEEYSETLSFTNEAHASLVKCLSVSQGGVLASAGSDEVIKLFDLVKRKEMGSLMHHNGSITEMSFFENKFLFTSCENGELAICNSLTWEVSHVLNHKSAINSFTIHPSGKLLLAACKDRTLQTWNLVSGRRAFVTNYKQAVEIVKFSLDGDKFVLITGKNIEIMNTTDGKIFGEISSSFRIVAAIFINSDILCVGGDEGMICFYNISTKDLIHSISTNTIRIKSMQFSTTGHLVSATSDGFILVHLIDIKANNCISSVLKKSIRTSHRWLCVIVFEEKIKPPNTEKKLSSKKLKARTNINTKSSLAHIVDNGLVDDDGDDDDGVEDDGSCASNDDENDEEKSYKDRQLKMKRTLQYAKLHDSKKQKLEETNNTKANTYKNKKIGLKDKDKYNKEKYSKNKFKNKNDEEGDSLRRKFNSAKEFKRGGEKKMNKLKGKSPKIKHKTQNKKVKHNFKKNKFSSKQKSRK